jgi:hypothetical protein
MNKNDWTWMVDTVFDDSMKPVFTNVPEVVKRRLHASYPESWTKVCVGETGKIVHIEEYLYKEKFNGVVEMLDEVLRKRELPLYKRNPERFEVYLHSTARRIIEHVLEEDR